MEMRKKLSIFSRRRWWKGLRRQFNENNINIMICRGTGGMVLSIRDMRRNQRGAETFGDGSRKIQ